jgi:hypothetical protein
MRWLAFVVALALGVAVGNACLLDLDHTIACGDGYVDFEAGEECDPADEDSFINACLGTIRPDGNAACDPVACEIINDRVQCAYCGDGLIDRDAGEECDGSNNAGACPTSGEVSCTSDTCKIDYSLCDKCGNGIVDPGEECDPGDTGGIAVPRPCAGTLGEDGLEPLKSPYLDQPYSSGNAVGCLDDCTFDRTECGYCGNGELEKVGELVSLPTQPTMIMSRPEKCDGEEFDLDELAEEFPCTDMTVGNVECSSNCLDFVPREGPACCLPRGAACPDTDEPPRCCHEFSEPEAEQHCSDPFAPPPMRGEPPPEGGAKACN